MSRASGSLPHVSRRSLSTSSLQRSSPKHTRSSGNLAKVKNDSAVTNLPHLISPTKEAPRLTGELCAICLEVLDDGVFAYPCGHNHKLHYQCAVHFLSSALSMPSLDGCHQAPLSSRAAKKMGAGHAGFRAISALEDAIVRAPPAILERLYCPLCRSKWPSSDVLAVRAIMARLRSVSIVGHRESSTKLANALARIYDRLENGKAERSGRALRGLRALRRNQHSASSFLASSSGSSGRLKLAVALLRFLRQDHVAQLSVASRASGRTCRSGSLLRAPSLKVTQARTATQYVHAGDVVALEVHAAAPSLKGGSITVVDAVAFSEWLQDSQEMQELTLDGLHWERADPEGSLLESCLSNKRLKYLQLSHNWLSDASVVILARLLLASSINSLETLILDLNCVTRVGLQAVLPLGRSPGRVCSWGFRHNELGDSACQLITEAALPNSAWDLRTNGVSPRGCRLLAPALERMRALRLGGNHLGDTGLMHLSPGIGESLQVLDLRQASFGDAGARELAWGLLNAASLEQLLLSGNDIRAEGAWALAEGWRWLLQLHHVDLSSNPIGSHGVERITEELPYWKQSPFRLSLIGISCGEEGMARLKAILELHPRSSWQWAIELQNNDPGPAVSRYIRDINHLLEARLLVAREAELD